MSVSIMPRQLSHAISFFARPIHHTAHPTPAVEASRITVDSVCHSRDVSCFDPPHAFQHRTLLQRLAANLPRRKLDYLLGGNDFLSNERSNRAFIDPQYF